MNAKRLLVDFLSDPNNFKFENGDFKASIENQSLVLLTAAGTISGVPIVPPSEVPCDDDADYFAFKIFSGIQAEISQRVTKSDNPMILLKDAVLLNASGDSICYRFLYVFVDDILGVTIGTLQ